MRYRCKSCDFEVERGFLPAATSGLYLVVLVGLTCAACLLVSWWIKPGTEPVEPAPWWWRVLALPLGVMLLFALTTTVNWSLESLEYVGTMRRSCPRCGARRWSWGFRRGFGL